MLTTLMQTEVLFDVEPLEHVAPARMHVPVLASTLTVQTERESRVRQQKVQTKLAKGRKREREEKTSKKIGFARELEGALPPHQVQPICTPTPTQPSARAPEPPGEVSGGLCDRLLCLTAAKHVAVFHLLRIHCCWHCADQQNQHKSGKTHPLIVARTPNE
jgi:hypothetical protein